MTDLSPTDDELVSAVLDGEAAADERARVETDPRLRQRRDQLAALRERLVSLPAPLPDALDRARDAALRAFDDAPDRNDIGTDGHRGGVHDLSRADGRRSWYQRVPMGAIAAALVVVALIGALSTIDFGSDSSDTATSSMDESAESFDDAGDDLDAGDGPASGGDDGSSAGAEIPEVVQGRSIHPDLDDLLDDLADRYDIDSPAVEEHALSPSSDGAATGDDGCDAVAVAAVDPESVIDVVPAAVAGRDVLAVVYDSEAGRRAAIVDEASCSLDDDRAL